jgi:hypothetical protein
MVILLPREGIAVLEVVPNTRNEIPHDLRKRLGCYLYVAEKQRLLFRLIVGETVLLSTAWHTVLALNADSCEPDRIFSGRSKKY